MELEKTRLPTKKEIFEKAQELYMADNARFQDLLGENLPEYTELSEEGYLRRAQHVLMSKKDPTIESKILLHVDTLKKELEQCGFKVTLSKRPIKHKKNYPRKKYLNYFVRPEIYNRFLKAGGYEVLKVAGTMAAAKVSGLSAVTVRRIIVRHPPTEPYVRTNWYIRRRTAQPEKAPFDWKKLPLKPETVERFIERNGYETAKLHGIKGAASICGLNRSTVSRILKQFPTKESYLQKVI